MDSNEVVSLERARTAKAEVMSTYMAVSEVVGVGIVRIGTGFGVKINLSSPLSNEVKLPQSINGVPIQVTIVGSVRKE